MDLKEAVATELEAVRGRSLDLLAPLDDAALTVQHSPLMSPLVWDLAHVGNYEELWLLRAVAGHSPIDASLDDIYDAFRHPRANRPALPLLDPDAARRYIASVRGRALDVLERVPPDSLAGGDGPLLAGGFVYGMVVQHEHQHDETMLATLQLMAGEPYPPAAASSSTAGSSGALAGPVAGPLAGPVAGPDEVLVAGGKFVMGTDTDPWSYDNERPSFVLDLPAFWIDRFPVTNGAFLSFIADGGYDSPRWWTPEGWEWKRSAGLEAPQFWQRGSGAGRSRRWSRLRFGFEEPLPLGEPVQHVCWYEADAYARWAGKRLPTEAEWEKAASWSSAGKSRFPWGDAAPVGELAGLANLGQRRFGPSPAGSHPGGVAPCGAEQMVGDVWEWTASDFQPHPGFASFPYREYSEVFFGPTYKVLRGGSWATDATAVRSTFRNWDYPIRRQIFAGFRCARDADG